MGVAEEVEEGTLLSVQVRWTCPKVEQWPGPLGSLIACSRCPPPILPHSSVLCA